MNARAKILFWSASCLVALCLMAIALAACFHIKAKTGAFDKECAANERAVRSLGLSSLPADRLEALLAEYRKGLPRTDAGNADPMAKASLVMELAGALQVRGMSAKTSASAAQALGSLPNSSAFVRELCTLQGISIISLTAPKESGEALRLRVNSDAEGLNRALGLLRDGPLGLRMELLDITRSGEHDFELSLLLSEVGEKGAGK